MSDTNIPGPVTRSSTRGANAAEPAPSVTPTGVALAITPEIEAYIAQQVRLLTQQQITEQNRRLSFLPSQVATPIRERPEATPPATKEFDIKTVFKHIKDDVKFTGSGKTPSQDLYNLQKQIEVAFHSVDAPQEYFDIDGYLAQIQ